MNRSHNKALIAMGGNLGNVAETFKQAIELLSNVKQIEVTACSNNYSTQPVGSNAGERFVNGAITVLTSLKPIDLLNHLQRIETELGRVRLQHWGPRAIDLDLILYGTEIIKSERLMVPHPATFYRRFVLDPATEIAGDWLHPEFQESLSHLCERLLLRPLNVCIHKDPELLKALESATDEAIAFSNELHSSSAIIFDIAGDLQFPQTVSLEGIADKLAFAQQVLIAATDEPRRNC